MTAANLQPDRASIADHLHHITRRWRELDEPCLLETVHLTAQDKADVRDVAHFTLDRVSEAADHIAAMNGHGLNSYVVVNPVSAVNRPKVGKRAAAEHILAAFFHWADADDETAADNIRNFAGPRPTFVVLTGTTPCKRPHVYWELEDPVRNLAAWSETQRAIARTLKSDGAVVDPPRIMRVAGTVNWPKPQKVAKGYVAEVCRLTIHSPDDRPPISADRMARVFATPKDEAKGDKGETFENFGEQPKGRTAEDYLALLMGARTDGEKHAAVRNLTWALAGNGVPRALCEALIRDVCPVWDDNVETLIETAYRGNFNQREAPSFDFDPSGFGDGGTWQIQPAGAFIADFVAPEYIIDGIVQRGRLYTLTAPTGSGKTAVMLYASVAIATGMQFCGCDTEPGDVLFLAGENPDDVRARVIGTLEHYGIDPERCRLHFIAGTFSIRADMERLWEEASKLPNLMMVVVDTFAAYFDGDDENSNAQALDFARVIRQITQFPSKPCAIMPAHPIKNATRKNLTPKGGSSLLNEVDGNLTLWNSDGLLSLHWQGKHRGPDFEPLAFELIRHESDSLKDRKGRLMPTILAQPVLTMRATEIAKQSLAIEDQILLSIHEDDSLSIADRCTAVGLVSTAGPQKSRMFRILDKLGQDKLLKKFRRKWVLTKDGEKAVEDILAGRRQPAEDME